MSQFTKVPVGEYMLRFWHRSAPPTRSPAVEDAVDEIVKALQAKGPTAAELEKVTRTWLNEQDARIKTNHTGRSICATGRWTRPSTTKAPAYVDARQGVDRR